MIVSILLEPNGPEKLARQEEGNEILRSVLDLMSGTSFFTDSQKKDVAEQGREAAIIAAALAFMIRVGKQKAPRGIIEQFMPSEALQSLLDSKEAKIRKNTGRLIGTLERRSMDQVLIEALERETVRMVKPSMLLALGVLGTEKASAFLDEYKVKEAFDASEIKHVREEEEALRKARKQLHKTEASLDPVFTGMEGIREFRVELRTERGFEEVLAQEVKEKRAARVVTVRPGAVVVEETGLERLMNVRSFKEWLIPMGTIRVEGGTEVAKVLGVKLLRYMKALHRGTALFRFRLESVDNTAEEMLKIAVGKALSRSEAVAAIAKEIEASYPENLENAPGNYSCELRIRKLPKAGAFVAYLKLFTTKDERFAYRKQSIAASIHPAGAAGLVQMAKPFVKEHAIVMDPCCGSGTLLLERAALQKRKPSVLFGSDLSLEALKAAGENFKADKENLKGVKVQLIKKDMLDLSHSVKVDELYANLPFGNRVGSHKENVILYKGLFDRLPQWIKQGGIAVLYSMEGKLLYQEAKRHPEMEVLLLKRVEAGGLEPTVMILRIR